MLVYIIKLIIYLNATPRVFGLENVNLLSQTDNAIAAYLCNSQQLPNKFVILCCIEISMLCGKMVAAVKINPQHIIVNYFKYIFLTFITLRTIISHRELTIINSCFLFHSVSPTNFIYFHLSDIFLLNNAFFALVIDTFTILVSFLELYALPFVS